MRNLSINLIQKESTQNHSSVKNDNQSRERKVSVFYSKITLTFTQVFPKALLGTLLKQKL